MQNSRVSLSESDLLPLADAYNITNQDFYNTVLQLPMGIAVFAGSNFITSVANDQYLTLIGRNREEFVGKPLFDAVPELRGQQVEELLTSVFTSGNPYYGNEFKASLYRNGSKN